MAFNFGGISGKVSNSGGDWLQLTLQGSCTGRTASVVGNVNGYFSDDFRTTFSIEGSSGNVITRERFGTGSSVSGPVSADVVMPCGLNDYVEAVATSRLNDQEVRSGRVFVD